jgi:hypothetical protein
MLVCDIDLSRLFRLSSVSSCLFAGATFLACSSTPSAPFVPNTMHDASLDAMDASHAADGAPEAGAQSVDVPVTISEEVETESMRFSVPVSIGGTSLMMQLDTGSSGLRIIKGAIPDDAFSRVTATTVSYSYHSGLVIQGVVAYATVALGSLATPAPIPVMLIEEASCIATMPDCGANGVPLSELTLFGPYKAILGVGMRNLAPSGEVGSPIPQFAGEPGFIVMAPVYGGTAGTLRIRPQPSQLAAFKTFDLPELSDGAPLANGVPSYDDRYGLPACLDDQTSGTHYCVGAELDTGNPPVYIEWPAHGDAGTTELPPGEKISLTLGPASAPLAQYSFTVGATPEPGIDEVLVESATGSGFMNVGTLVFFHYDVYLDQAHGLVGLAPH